MIYMYVYIYYINTVSTCLYMIYLCINMYPHIQSIPLTEVTISFGTTLTTQELSTRRIWWERNHEARALPSFCVFKKKSRPRPLQMFDL